MLANMSVSSNIKTPAPRIVHTKKKCTFRSICTVLYVLRTRVGEAHHHFGQPNEYGAQRVEVIRLAGKLIDEAGRFAANLRVCVKQAPQVVWANEEQPSAIVSSH